MAFILNRKLLTMAWSCKNGGKKGHETELENVELNSQKPFKMLFPHSRKYILLFMQ